MSQRSKRRRGPQRSGGEAAAGGEAAPPGGEAGPSGGPSREGRQTARTRPGTGAPSPRAPSPRAASRRGPSGWNLGVQLAFLVAVFAVVVLVAELAGAANLGVALGVGQIAFAIAVIYLLLRR